METLGTGVVVLGSGLAGIMSALTARKSGLDVTLLDDPDTPSATGSSGGSFRAEIDGYSALDHFVDTVTYGERLSQRSLARSLAEDAGRIRELLGGLGLQTVASDTGFRLASGNEPGKALAAAGLRSLREAGVKIIPAMGWELLRRADGSAAGVLAYDPIRATWLAVTAGSVILATGGGAGVFERTTNSRDAVGDGIALAFRAGAVLADMEFVQFWPLAAATKGSYACLGPKELAGRSLLVDGTRDISEKVDLARLGKGQSPAKLARLVYQEIMPEPPMGTPSQAVEPPAPKSLTLSAPLAGGVAGSAADTLAGSEVSPAAHHTLGGVVCGDHGQTRIPGLFVAGEAAAGTHGADRLSGNGLSEAAVFGCRAGALAASELRAGRGDGSPDNVEAEARDMVRRVRNLIEGRSGGSLEPAAAQARVRQAMWRYSALVRTRESLDFAQSAINRVKRSLPFSVDVSDGRQVRAALKTLNMLVVAEAITRSARFRKESRGVHFRADYPEADDGEWLRHVRVRLLSGEMSLDTTEGLDLMTP